MRRYIAAFAASVVLAGPACVGAGLAVAPAPIEAEYWVRQMRAVKLNAALAEPGPKGLIVAGSSGLFGIDAEELTRGLGVPFVNLSLHARMPLDDMLDDAVSASRPGDAVLLALEPSYYCATYHDWYVRNRIAWMPERYGRRPWRERLEEMAREGPFFALEVMRAGFERGLLPALVRSRLDALDDALTLTRYATHPPPRRFAYSPYNLDARGDIQMTDAGPDSFPAGTPPDTVFSLCAATREALQRFATAQARRGVATYFANAPFEVEHAIARARIDAAAHGVESELGAIAPLVDTRADVTYARPAFFDASVHLNAKGRAMRTQALVNALRANVDASAWLARARRARNEGEQRRRGPY
jgi:hypothetical protein